MMTKFETKPFPEKLEVVAPSCWLLAQAKAADLKIRVTVAIAPIE